MSLEEDFFCPRMSHSLQRQLVSATFQIIRSTGRPCQKVLSVKLILKEKKIVQLLAQHEYYPKIESIVLQFLKISFQYLLRNSS